MLAARVDSSTRSAKIALCQAEDGTVGDRHWQRSDGVLCDQALTWHGVYRQRVLLIGGAELPHPWPATAAEEYSEPLPGRGRLCSGRACRPAPQALSLGPP